MSPARKACAHMHGTLLRKRVLTVAWHGDSESPFHVGWSQQVNRLMLTGTEMLIVNGEASVSLGLGTQGPCGVGLELEKQTQHPHPRVWVG